MQGSYEIFHIYVECGSDGKESAWKFRRTRFDPWIEKIPCSRVLATHTSIIAWRIPWTEEPGGLEYMGSKRVGQDWETNTFLTFLCKNYMKYFIFTQNTATKIVIHMKYFTWIIPLTKIWKLAFGIIVKIHGLWKGHK